MRKITRPVCPNPVGLSTNYKHPDNKAALVMASHGKCMYCESKVTAVSFGDVEHIKPKSKYPQLKFEWTNLGFVCSKCNIAKKDKFEEEKSYINPYDEEPNDHVLAFGSFIQHKAGSERGELTVIDIDLNRPELVEKRGEKIKFIQKWIDLCMRTSSPQLKAIGLEELLEECKEDKEFSVLVEQLFKSHGIL